MSCMRATGSCTSIGSTSLTINSCKFMTTQFFLQINHFLTTCVCVQVVFLTLSKFTMAILSVNINKIATLRNARGGNVPNLVKVALDIERYGAQGITIHPRPDERHIRYQDARDLKKVITTELNRGQSYRLVYKTSRTSATGSSNTRSRRTRGPYI